MIYRCTLTLAVHTARGRAAFRREVEREALPAGGRVIDFSPPGRESAHRHRVVGVVERFHEGRCRVFLEDVYEPGRDVEPRELFRAIAGEDAASWTAEEEGGPTA